ncbi:MAG: peptidase S10, partial [Pseudobdellovibrionaceae bacterium]
DRQFAQGEYAHALLVGDDLDEESFQKFARKVQFYTGLSEEYIKQSRLKINKFRFLEEFLKSQTKVIGRFDCRISGPNTLQWCSGYSYDPSLELYLGPYTAAFNHYVRSDLKWDSPEEYVILATNIKWDFTKATNKYLDVSGDVLEAMTKNGRLKLFIGNGYYDLALPYASTVYTLNHMGLTPEQHKKVTLKEYEGGHMMYHDKKNLELLKRDLADFY